VSHKFFQYINQISKSMMQNILTIFLQCLALLSLVESMHQQTITAFSPNPIDRISNDLSALKCSVTARHILLPKSTEVVLALKQKIRNRVCDKERPIYIEDAFALAAEKYSQDYKTKGKGGLVGTLIRQGHYPCPKLDQAFYRLPLGEISGPIESSYGYHLVLICERRNCPRIDGEHTRIIRKGQDGTKAVLVGPKGSKNVESESTDFGFGQLAFWTATGLAGGVMADLAASTAGVLSTLPQ